MPAPRRPFNHEPPLSIPTRLAPPTPAPRMDRAWERGRAGMTDDALPTPRSIPHGYVVSAWCRACQHTVRLDLRALVAGGHGDVPLIHLPMRCRCGSDQFGIIVGEVSAGKSAACPGAAPHARAITAAAAGLASCSPASRAPPADRCAGSCFSPAEACGRTHPRRRVVPFPQGRHVRPPCLSRCRHARATPQPVASAATLPRRRPPPPSALSPRKSKPALRPTDETKSAVVTARRPGARRVDVPDLTPEELQRRGEAAGALWRELVRRVTAKDQP